MNSETKQVFGSRTFRIAVIAVSAVVVLGSAAYLFGTGLRAAEPAAVAPSPLGSSLTVAREVDMAAANRAALQAMIEPAQTVSRSVDDFGRRSPSAAMGR